MDEALKPCPFCGGEADYHSEKGPTGEVYGWVGCNQCDAMSCHTDTRSMQPEETHPIDAWNTRADAAPTPKADEVEAVARAICATRGLSPDALYQHHEWEPWPIDRRDEYVGLGGEVRINLMHYAWRHHTERAQAAIAALDAARGDPVARVVEFIREQQANADKHMREAARGLTESHFAAAFVTLRNLADEIERGDPFNG